MNENVKKNIENLIEGFDEFDSKYVTYNSKVLRTILEETLSYIKRKEQECKNLEEELRGCRIGIKDISIENTEICKISEKYKRVLDEIEKFAQDIANTKEWINCTYNALKAESILVIINKAKEQ